MSTGITRELKVSLSQCEDMGKMIERIFNYINKLKTDEALAGVLISKITPSKDKKVKCGCGKHIKVIINFQIEYTGTDHQLDDDIAEKAHYFVSSMVNCNFAIEAI